ncbi:hypothetical protein [Kaarinaea lacus]
MEHRWSIRLPSSIKVLLYINGSPVCACATQNIGKEGMYINSKPEMHRINTLYEVAFQAPGFGRRRWFRMPAIVAHISETGLGLYIERFDQEAFAAWQWLLQSGETECTSGILNMSELPD